MSSDGASSSLSVTGLWKTFAFYRHPLHRLAYWASRGRRGAPELFHALRDVSFRLPRGTSTGIIGVNGAGKSTLLKIITGTLEPTRGTVELEGRIASLLELGTGFHPMFTGRQNIVYNARFLGLSDEEIQARLPEIEAFSELAEFLERPLRTYSSGMQVRLAFAVAASVSPDVLIVDEVLAVGDAYFQQKCIRRIRDFRDRGVTILFVSHEPGAVTALCDRALLLHQGAMVDDDTPARVLEQYNALIARKAFESPYFAAEKRKTVASARRSGSFDALVTDVQLLGEDGTPVRAVLAGAEVTFLVRVLFLVEKADPTIGLVIRDRLGNDVYGTNTYHQRIATGTPAAGDTLEARFKLRLDIGAGEYAVSAAVHSSGVHLADSYDWVDGALVFRVLAADDRPAIGVAHLRPEVVVASGIPPAPVASAIGAALGDLPAAVATGDDGGALLRTGWYAVEGTGADAFRWTRDESSVFLDLRGSRLCFEVGASRPAGSGAVELVVSTVGHELGRVELQPDTRWHEVTLPLPADVPRGPARLRLAVRPCWRPADTGHSADSRLLGVRVRRIWSSP